MSRLATIGMGLLMMMSTALAAEPPEIVRRSILSPGDSSRLWRVFDKAQRGESIVVGVIGGSITAGASATTEDKRYANLLAEWWRKKFPQSKITLVNAGIGATGSNYASQRVRRDLLAHRPDFVVQEFAVNDLNVPLLMESFEGLTRQVLSAPSQPAVVLLFTMDQLGRNTQAQHGRIGQHYGLPMISYRDAFWPEIEANRLTWHDISPDVVHPNDRGHAACAQFIIQLLEDALAAKAQVTESTLPPPLVTDLFQHTTLLEGGDLKPLSNTGWTQQGGVWSTEQPGSAIEFEIEGRLIYAAYFRIRGAMGRASVQVDDLPPTTLEGWFEATWGGYRESTMVGKDLPPGKHRVKFTLLEDKAQLSTGREFKILGLASAGTKD